LGRLMMKRTSRSSSPKGGVLAQAVQQCRGKEGTGSTDNHLTLRVCWSCWPVSGSIPCAGRRRKVEQADQRAPLAWSRGREGRGWESADRCRQRICSGLRVYGCTRRKTEEEGLGGVVWFVKVERRAGRSGCGARGTQPVAVLPGQVQSSSHVVPRWCGKVGVRRCKHAACGASCAPARDWWQHLRHDAIALPAQPFPAGNQGMTTPAHLPLHQQINPLLRVALLCVYFLFLHCPSPSSFYALTSPLVAGFK
jgi:hypothetical protein